VFVYNFTNAGTVPVFSFLDKLDNGKLYFANINHVYKKNDKNKFSNISTDKVPEVSLDNIKKE